MTTFSSMANPFRLRVVSMIRRGRLRSPPILAPNSPNSSSSSSVVGRLCGSSSSSVVWISV